MRHQAARLWKQQAAGEFRIADFTIQANIPMLQADIIL